MCCFDISFYVFLSPLFHVFSFPQPSISTPFYYFLFLSSSSSPLFLSAILFVQSFFRLFLHLCYFFFTFSFFPLSLSLSYLFLSSLSVLSILASRTFQTQGSIKWLAFNFYPRTTKYQGKKRDYLYA